MARSPCGVVHRGCLCLPSSPQHHLILINLARIDHHQPQGIEIVVAEELLHMRHWLDGDRRRHARHGYDRIAVQVADLVSCSLEDVRSALLPINPSALSISLSMPHLSSDRVAAQNRCLVVWQMRAIV